MADPISLASRRRTPAVGPKPTEDERAYDAERAKAVITQYLGILRDKSSASEAIQFLENTLMAIGGVGQRALTAAALEGVADSLGNATQPLSGADVAAILRGTAEKIRTGGE